MLSLTFFGTDQFAADILEPLITSGLFKIDAIITQPDRPTGRKQDLAPAPVKELGIKDNIPVLQPPSLKSPISSFEFPISDVYAVFHYGLIIPTEILKLPQHGTLNLHPSLLPKYRGASPIRSALINGETATGLTVMLMDEQMDHGPVLTQEKITIDPDDTNATLTQKITPLGSAMLLKVIPEWIAGKIEPQPQNHAAATFCKLVTRDDGKINWQQSADEIYNLYRGLTPWPGIWTMWNGKRLKLLKIKLLRDQSNPHLVLSDTSGSGEVVTPDTNDPTSPPLIRLHRVNPFAWKKGGIVRAAFPAQAGTVTTINNQLFITCNSGNIEILELQLEGKKPMPAKEFLNGNQNIIGAKL